MIRVFLLIFTLCVVSFATNASPITNPSISRRCSALMEARNKKVAYKQKLNALLLRTQKLKKLTPLDKKSLAQKLNRTHRKLTHFLKLSKAKIQLQEENIIRKGCPGLQL